MTDTHATDDGLKLAKLVAYVDDGRDYTARIIWRMNRKRWLHEKRIVPMPPAPKVAAGNVEIKKPKVKRQRRKVTEVE
ncbi:hypothetical protein QON05_003094 [Salmonella enterica]|uniref:Uncharacterized protein n=3 Tax=Salmonella enterica I TaxID=59201 RepID=A0A5U8JIZ8_SALET|nr:hypothetical protein [Salmonella enterica]EBR7997405.1 hypothetical protein [Salmonella enterica subsp. enterica serovar Panama]EBS4087208.1 hypothetical protein [Salmonella enterica subsp. enterica serovar Newport]ECF6945287.1 hypothetical protein [Salmonella enterica subsp. diarizonae]ECG3787039.1 hypothetical protein [Salmonella enterica subsp. enterica serovar Florida]ASD86120.1 hypothetical protein LFZ16_07605 [Salmonella enterica subsp. enterica serovar India str. SA20085604]